MTDVYKFHISEPFFKVSLMSGDSWLYQSTSQLEGSKVIFYYLDRFFRNLAKTDKNYAFGYHSHIAIFLVASS